MPLLGAALQIYSILIFIRVIYSWLPPRHRAGEFYAFLYSATEPVLRQARRIVPPIGGIDLSPIIVLVLLSVLARAFGV